MKRTSETGAARALAALLIAACAGCATAGKVPQLVERSVMTLEAVVETDPSGARLHGEDLLSLGPAPFTKKWEIEKLTWSDGTVHFRLMPYGRALEEGDVLSFYVTAAADGYIDESARIKATFAGRSDTLREKIVLRKAGETEQ